MAELDKTIENFQNLTEMQQKAILKAVIIENQELRADINTIKNILFKSYEVLELHKIDFKESSKKKIIPIVMRSVTKIAMMQDKEKTFAFLKDLGPLYQKYVESENN